MNLTNNQKRIIAALLIVMSFSLVVYALTSGVAVSGTIALNASDGPLVLVEVDGDSELGLEDAIPDSETVNVSVSEGHIVFQSSGPTNATIHEDNVSGTYTTVSDLDVTENELSINPSDKQRVDVSGNLDSIQFKDSGVDDGEVDFIYTGSSGTSNITIYNVETTDRNLGAIDSDTGEVLGTAIPDEDGTVAFTNLPNSETGVEIQIVPWEMRVFDESNPGELIDDREISADFFDLDGNTISSETTTDGTISFENLTDSTFVVQLSTDGYHDRPVIVKNVFDQSDVWLLNESVSSQTPTFTIRDRTGEFDPISTRVYVQRGLEIDGETRYRVIAAEEVGTDGFTVDLESGQRYRIQVENQDGDTRVLGAYRATSSGIVELDIGEVVADPTAPDQVTWNAERTNESGSVFVKFEYNDSSQNTDRIWLHIYERGNESNELLENTSFTGPYGEFSFSQQVDEGEENTEWVVEWYAERSSPNERGSTIIGPTRAILQDIPGWLRTIIAVGTIWMVAGLFSQLNGHIGAIVVSALGGLFYYVDFLPEGTGLGIVLLAMLTAGVIFMNERRASAI